jgi:hypothetical protein
MSCDYKTIRADNERRYGTDIGRIGPMLLADRYDDRTHFIFELLQNAEDALDHRPGWQGSRAVTFTLSETALRVGHFGKPFNEPDVRGICGIAESTKDLTAIGCFGIGFKSVYAFTDEPEVHSGSEDFVIESFVLPAAVPRIERLPDETVFVLPLRRADATAFEEITQGLQRLGARSLLFLRQIEEIAWDVKGGPSGLYLRSKPEAIGENVFRISLIGEEQGKPEVEETWLIFSREARTDQGKIVGHLEVAFSIVQVEGADQWSIQTVPESPLVVFFPTVLPTHLGFLVQGPYRTTPSRDNVPRNDLWNQHLVQETAGLLVEALSWLRDDDMLNSDVLQCLPIDRTKFPEGSRFAPLFEAVRNALASEPLLPRFDGGYIPGKKAKLASTQELRELFDPGQLSILFDAQEELAWLSAPISQDRTSDLRQYLMRELSITEVRTETILPKLNKPFLEAQSDEWVLKLYEFLNSQPALLRQKRLQNLPLIRLEDGSHVTANVNGQLQAFLPGAVESSFPTVRQAVCATDEAKKFLQSLDLVEPNPVDDVIRNVLPRYSDTNADVRSDVYESDISRIITAFDTDSKAQRDKLVSALRETHFIKAKDSGDGAKQMAKPGNVYLATERLKNLFAGVLGILLVDDSVDCLRGEPVRNLLVAVGASRYLRPLQLEPTWEKRFELRKRAGTTGTRSAEHIEDYSLHGFEPLLGRLSSLGMDEARCKAELLWEALCDLQDRDSSKFKGSYSGQYHGPRSCEFEPSFVELLNSSAWVPDSKGDLQRPEFVVFDSLGWKANPFLFSKIRFKPPLIETLAKEAGIEPGLLDLLKKLGVTSEAELRNRLGMKEQPQQPEDEPSRGAVEDAIKKLLGNSPGPTPPVSDSAGPESVTAGSGHRGGESGGGASVRGEGGTQPVSTAGGRTNKQAEIGGTGKNRPRNTGARPFISYVAACPNDEEKDPDGLDQKARMELEEKAIALICSREPKLRRTPQSNPGFDLFEEGADGTPSRWIEVKAMTADLQARPIGLSKMQFDWACQHGDAYWLYVVEHAGELDRASIIRIQDPAGKARTFLFDKGWRGVAESDESTGMYEEPEGG